MTDGSRVCNTELTGSPQDAGSSRGRAAQELQGLAVPRAVSVSVGAGPLESGLPLDVARQGTAIVDPELTLRLDLLGIARRAGVQHPISRLLRSAE